MPTHPQDLIDRKLGPYTVAELIGSNPYAWIFRAVGADRRAAALKVLKPQFSGERQFRSQFHNEFAIGAALAHPNIIKVRDEGETDGLLWFAMDFYVHSLKDRIGEDGSLEEQQVIRLGKDIAAALEYAHAQGVVHRDIKPENILYTGDNTAILADFGISGAVDGRATAGTGANMTIGTPHYLSPEQACGKELDGRSDLYSLGVTLYRISTGIVPFRSSDWFELARQHVEEIPTAPRTHRPDLTTRLERIILKLMAKEAAGRYQTPRELLEDLNAVRSEVRGTDTFGTGEVAASASHRHHVPERPWLKRSAAIAVVLVVATLIAILGSR